MTGEPTAVGQVQDFEGNLATFVPLEISKRKEKLAAAGARLTQKNNTLNSATSVTASAELFTP